MQQSNFSDVRSHFKSACDKVIDDQDVLLVTRRDAENVVVMSQALFDSWQETVYLLKSPANAVMLMESIGQHKQGEVVERALISEEN